MSPSVVKANSQGFSKPSNGGVVGASVGSTTNVSLSYKKREGGMYEYFSDRRSFAGAPDGQTQGVVGGPWEVCSGGWGADKIEIGRCNYYTG